VEGTWILPCVGTSLMNGGWPREPHLLANDEGFTADSAVFYE